LVLDPWGLWPPGSATLPLPFPLDLFGLDFVTVPLLRSGVQLFEVFAREGEGDGFLGTANTNATAISKKFSKAFVLGCRFRASMSSRPRMTAFSFLVARFN
jgi:hypothetical protein